MRGSILGKLDAMPGAWKHAAVAALLLILAFLNYSNSFNCAFHLDDYHQIVENQGIRSLGNIPRFFVNAGLGSHWSDSPLGLKGYRPVTYTSFALNYALSGYHVWSYHLFNILLHFLNSFLVFLVVKAVLGKNGRRDFFSPALLASMIFALHPVQTGAVTYISGRAAMLAAFFYLLAFYSFLRYRSGGGYIFAALSPAFYCLGLLSKEIAVSLIAVVIVYDLIFTVPQKGGLRKSARLCWYYVPFAAILALFVFSKEYLVGHVATGEVTPGVGEYVITEAKVFLMYLRLLFFPINQNIDYNLPVTRSADLAVIVSAALIGFSIYCIYRLRPKHPALSFFGAWFLLTLAPESSLIPIADVAVEYRLYLPSAGFIAFFAAASAFLPGRKVLKGAAAAVLLAMLTMLSLSRNQVMSSSVTLWDDVVKKAPYSARAHANLGKALLDDGRYREAATELRASLGMSLPNDLGYYFVYNNLGLCYLELGMRNAAIAEFKKAVDIMPGLSDAYYNLGETYYTAGRYPEALGAFLEAVRASPRDFDARYGLAEAYYVNGMREKASEQAGMAAGLAVNDGQREKAERLTEKARQTDKEAGGGR